MPSAESTAPERNLSWQSANSESSAPIDRQPIQPRERRRGAAAEIGDAVGQRPDERAGGIATGEALRGVIELERNEVDAALRAGAFDVGEFPRQIG